MGDKWVYVGVYYIQKFIITNWFFYWEEGPCYVSSWSNWILWEMCLTALDMLPVWSNDHIAEFLACMHGPRTQIQMPLYINMCSLFFKAIQSPYDMVLHCCLFDVSRCWRLFMIKLWNHNLLDARTMNNCNIILESYQERSDPKQSWHHCLVFIKAGGVLIH